MNRTTGIVAVTVIVAILSGCATVAPYQRGLLVARHMQEPLDPLDAAMDGHVYGTREMSMGASPAGGASCGCM